MEPGEYMDRAKARARIPSDAQLARMLGHASSQMSMWRRGWVRPNLSAMVRLAQMGGITTDRALLDWLSWQAPDNLSRAAVESLKSRLTAQ